MLGREDRAADVESKVEALNPQSRQVNTTVKVVSKSPSRETVSRTDGSKHYVSDVLVGDETGTIILSLWDDAIEKINEGDTISITNGYISLFRGSMRLNIGKYGKFDPSQKEIPNVNTDNNLSDRRVEEERRIPTFRPAFGGGRERYGREGRGFRGRRGRRNRRPSY